MKPVEAQRRGCAVASSRLVRYTAERPVLVRAPLPGKLRCVTRLLSTQVYKWVAENLTLGVILRWTSIPSRVE